MGRTSRTLLVTRRLPEDVERRIARDFDPRLNEAGRALSREEILAGAAGAVAIICTPMDRFDAEMISQLPATVAVLGTFSVGTDHIDMAAAAARGLAVCNTPDVLSAATAECALLLILAAARRASEGERLVRTGEWSGWTPTQLLGLEVCGRNLGILGMGRIGRKLADMARGLGMTIHYRNRTRLPDHLECGAIYHESDETFLRSSQVLSLHAPGGDATYRWLNADRINLMPDRAIVVNTARGSLVDDDALMSSLKSGKLFAAGLDVFEGEPRLRDEYRTMRNVFLLPHLGSATEEARARMGHLVVDGIEATLSGGQPHNLVRKE